MSKENLYRLGETFAKMRDMYRVIDSRTASSGGFRTDMRSYAETLELAIHDIREAQTLLNPLNETGASVPHSHLELARDLLKQTITTMRSSMDPDRVLRVHDRMAIYDDMTNFVAEQRLKPRGSSAASGSSLPGLEGPGADAVGGPGEGIKNDAKRSLSDLSGEEEPSPFESDDQSPKKQATSRKRLSMSNSSEVTWRGQAMFKGNGKRITRDGPHLVITDSGLPPSPAISPRVKPARRRTVMHSDSLAGRLATAEQSQNTTTTRARATRARKTRATTTVSAKKRKPTSRKLASPTAGETA
ncbi:unnamed protein product [Chondrus crispus]|uniref:Uncharacterized protein n=1 Tax=Chondrus crispus TaxID=2769 RepID=R7QE85_CHOCR|nr:unnamed protein product [Chondrus crispus]CDF36389.1 unnamed protein product [Chondrus crispus]|eukprot:XP_005716208.1 unnamed protein product [Chondrus crispus]